MDLNERLELFLAKTPCIHETVYLAPGSFVIGDVTIGRHSSVWFNSVVRADIQKIEIGEYSNIQDNSVIHLENSIPTIVGNYVVVGHNAILHACTIEDEVLIGMGAVILDGARIGSGSIIGAQSLVTKNTVIPPNSLVMGTPGRVVREVKPDERSFIRPQAEKYAFIAAQYLKGAGGIVRGGAGQRS